MLGRLFHTMQKLLSRMLGQKELGSQSGSSGLRPDSLDSQNHTLSQSKAVSVKNVVWGSNKNISKEMLDSLAWTCLTLMPKRDLSVFMGEMLGCMAFETGYTFNPSQKNAAGSSGTGLIQFMGPTAKSLGTTTTALAKMTQQEQMAYVYKYFRPYAGKLHSLADIYLAIFYPAAMGKPDGFVIASAGSLAYTQNRGLDRAKKGYVTKADAIIAVTNAYNRGKSELFTGLVHPYAD